MPNIFLISDFHFQHQNACMFTRPNGKKMRPFEFADEADEVMIENWNRVVRPNDKAYCCGDIAMTREGIKLAGRLNGHKRLVRGNHDRFDLKFYLPFFEEVYATRLLDSMLLSHIPIHPMSLNRRWLGNIHGHVHNNVPAGFFGPRYLNVSVEVLDYTPISLEDAKLRLKAQIAAAPPVDTIPLVSGGFDAEDCA